MEKFVANFFFKDIKSNNQFLYSKNTISVYIKREDQLDVHVSGNKYRKLKYNFQQALKNNQTTILTFGGAYSNHIAATAYAGKIHNLKTIGIIRGEELQDKLEHTLATNTTLQFAKKCGMKFKFVTRQQYREKENLAFIESLKHEFGNFYLIPEGGTNKLAVKGCEEILTKKDTKFHYICLAVGTGGTIAGIINSANENQKIIGFSALKGNFHKKNVAKLIKNKNNWEINTNYHFGGFAKVNDTLITHINEVKKQFNIALDPIYTGKMSYGIDKMIEQQYFKPNTNILMIHTGGLQGINTMNQKLIKKNKEIIR